MQESAELLRWLPTAFNDLISPELAKIDLYPSHLRSQIDTITEWMQRDLNTGVYKAGFAPDQEVYEKNLPAVFAALNKLEEIVHKNGGPYILGKELTELDLRAYATVVRFDTVYVQHFKCNLGTIRHDYPVLNNWLKNLYWNVKGFKESTDFKHIKENVSCFPWRQAGFVVCCDNENYSSQLLTKVIFQYTKSHYGINPKAITPLGPYPDVEEGVQDFSTLKPGSVRHPAVVEYQAKL